MTGPLYAQSLINPDHDYSPQLREILARLSDLNQPRHGGYVDWAYALAFVMLDEHDKAMEALGDASVNGWAFRSWGRIEPAFAALRDREDYVGYFN